MGNKKTYVEKQDEEAEKNDMCDVGGRRRSTVLDTYKQGDAGTGEGEVHYWRFTNKEMLAREKEKNYFGTYEKANTHMEKQEGEAG